MREKDKPQETMEDGRDALESSTIEVSSAVEGGGNSGEELSARLDSLIARAVVEQAPSSLSVQVMAQVRAEGRPRLILPRRRTSRTGLWLSLAAVGVILAIGLLTVLPSLSGALGLGISSSDVVPLINTLPIVATLGFALFSVARTLINLRRDRALRRYAPQRSGSR